MSNTIADYNLWMVALSYLVSVIGSFTALTTAQYIRDTDGSIHGGWLLTSAVTLGGCAVWAMHFIGMLAYSPGAALTFDIELTVISFIAPIVLTGAGLYVVYRWHGNTRAWLLAGTVLGLGVAAMHYMGMAAVRIEAVMTHDHALFALSIVIAIVAATAALWIAVNTTGALRNASALVMGVAVCGMHYTGMAAMRLTPQPMEMDHFTGAVTEPMMRGMVTLAAVATCAIGLIFAANRYLHEHQYA